MTRSAGLPARSRPKRSGGSAAGAEGDRGLAAAVAAAGRAEPRRQDLDLARGAAGGGGGRCGGGGARFDALLAARILIAAHRRTRARDGAARARCGDCKLAAGEGGRPGQPRFLPGARRRRGRATALAGTRSSERSADPARRSARRSRDLIARFGGELPAELSAYVAISRSRARRRQQLVAAAAVVFFVLAVAASVAHVLAYRAEQRALAAEQRALAERDKATRSFKLAQGIADSLVFDIAQGLRNVAGHARGIGAQDPGDREGDLRAAGGSRARRSRAAAQSCGDARANSGSTYLTLGDLTRGTAILPRRPRHHGAARRR